MNLDSSSSSASSSEGSPHNTLVRPTSSNFISDRVDSNSLFSEKVSATATHYPGVVEEATASSPSRATHHDPDGKRVNSKSALVRPISKVLWLQKQRAKRRAVHFDLSGNRVVEIRSLSNEDDNVKKLLWYSKSDYLAIEAEMRETTIRIGRGLPEPHGLCYRGLEHYLVTCSRPTRVVRAQTIVFDACQSSEDGSTTVMNPEKLAEHYASVTRHCQAIAQEIGRADARTARAILSSSGLMDQLPTPPKRKWMTPPAC